MPINLKDGVDLSHRDSFETFKSNICHLVKDLGELEFIKFVLLSNEAQKLFEHKWYPESFYLVAMTDYLSRKNDILLYNGFDTIRSYQLKKPVYPSSIYMRYLLSNDERILIESFENAIPEFKRFNIVENEVENVV